MATPLPFDVIVLSARAVCATLTPASTSLSLMRARTVPPSATLDSAMATDRAKPVPAPMEPPTATPNTLLVNPVLSVAVSSTEPAEASTSEPSSMSVSTRLVEITDALEPAAVPVPETRGRR